MASTKFPTLQIAGLVDNQKASELQFLLPQAGVRVKKVLFPSRLLLSSMNKQDPLTSVPLILQLRSLLLTLWNSRKAIAKKRWKAIILTFDLSKHDFAQVSKALHRLDSMQVYISRQVGLLGIQVKKFDLSLEYDLTRKPQDFDLILSRGTLRLTNFFYKSGTNVDWRKIAGLEEANLKVISSTFIIPALRAPTLDSALLGKFSDHMPVEVAMRASLVGRGIPVSVMGTRWRYIIFPQCAVLHGQLLMHEDYFYVLDPSRATSWKSDQYKVPSLLFESSQGRWMTPQTYCEYTALDEAILLAGTNNLMHTVLEDLPRIIQASREGVVNSVPIIVSSKISPQIRDLLSIVSGRKILQYDLYTKIRVGALHFFEFLSPLPEVMSGKFEMRGDLFTHDMGCAIRLSLEETKPIPKSKDRRILILREPHLFRQLTNVQEIRTVLESEFGFETIYLERLSFERTRQIFQEAALVVGEYGAGLANCIHMTEGTDIVEICGPQQTKSREYKILAEAFGLNHHLLVGYSKTVSSFGISKSSYGISKRALTELLRSILANV